MSRCQYYRLIISGLLISFCPCGHYDFLYVLHDRLQLTSDHSCQNYDCNRMYSICHLHGFRHAYDLHMMMGHVQIALTTLELGRRVLHVQSCKCKTAWPEDTFSSSFHHMPHNKLQMLKRIRNWSLKSKCRFHLERSSKLKVL